jgi:uncharacterized protein
MPTAIIIHGLEGTPEKNWYPWLKQELENQGWTVLVPQFPNPNTPLRNEWTESLFSLKAFVHDDLVFITHSLGVPFILGILEKKKAKAAYLVGGFVGDLDSPEDEARATFTRRKFDWTAIKRHCPRFFVLNSDNDPYVPLAKGQELAEHLGVKVTFVPGAGHFNKTAGYTSFPFLLEMVKKMK